MSEAVVLHETPQAQEIYMIAGWRQWADAGSVSSALPQFLIQQTGAKRIGEIRPDGFYMFQIPGTHDLVRPVVKFDEGFPQSLETRRNEFFYTGDDERGVVFFLGDEPHLDVERYVTAMLDAATQLNVKRIIGLAGVYGELPYDKARTISAIYSQRRMKAELESFALNFSGYHGGASIGSYLCRRAGEREMEYISFYAMVPTYDFSNLPQIGKAIRIENDFMAWYGIVRRINHMLKTRFDLTELEEKSTKLREMLDAKVDELDDMAPDIAVREYMRGLAEGFEEVTFDPLENVWAQEIDRLFTDDDEG